MKHRHSGPSVRYRTKRGRTMSRKRPMHPITRKHKIEGRRGSRHFLGFNKWNKKEDEERLREDHDEFDRLQGQIDDLEYEQKNLLDPMNFTSGDNFEDEIADKERKIHELMDKQRKIRDG